MFAPVAGPLLLTSGAPDLPALTTWGCLSWFIHDTTTAMLAHVFASHRLLFPAPHGLLPGRPLVAPMSTSEDARSRLQPG
ncbi:hypothetical protein J2741_000245 [Methanolinea mesophila]|nr:hypothetical protein [Methanolinea mesophila]